MVCFPVSVCHHASTGMHTRPTWAAFLITSVASFLLYWFSLPPHLGLGMSGAYATGSYYAGVAHPSGDPVWTLYAWLITHATPFGNIAWRAAVASALAASVACGLIAALITETGAWVLAGIHRFRRLPPLEESWLRAVGGAVGGLAFGLTPGLWRKAITADPHSFGILLFCAGLACLARWYATPQKRAWLLWSIVAYGLSLVSSPHLFAAAFGLLIIVLLGDRALGRDLIGISGCLLLAGLVWESTLGFPLIFSNLMQFDGLFVVYLVAGLGATGLGAYAAIRTWRFGTEWAWVAKAIVVLFACLSLYLIAPISSLTNPPVNWSYSRTAEGFAALIGRAQYSQIEPQYYPPILLSQLSNFGPRILAGFSWLFLIPAAIPLLPMKRYGAEARRWIWGLLALAGSFALIILTCLNPPLDGSLEMIMPYFAGFHALLAILAGYGLVIAGTVTGRQGLESGQPADVT